MTVRTRFAPSPTGFLHIGGARTGSVFLGIAKKHDGDFIYVLRYRMWLAAPRGCSGDIRRYAMVGLDYDEGPFYQINEWIDISK